MALPKEDEMLLAGLYDQALARRGGSSPALNRMQSMDPAINPPPPPRMAAPAALTTPLARSTRGGPAPLTLPANRQGGPAPLPAIAQPRPAAKPVAVQPGMTHVGRAGMPASVVAQAGHGRGAAPPPTPLPVATKPATPAVTNTQVPAAPVAPVAQTPLTPQQNTLDPSGNFRRLTGKAASTALNSGNLGSAAIQGRFLQKDGTRGPQETRAYTQGGIQDAGKQVNVVPGLFSGVSQETEAALSEARKAAADRGDFEAVERSYMTPEQKQAANVQRAENKILGAVGGAPLSQLPQVAQAVSGIGAGRTAAATGAQTLQKGAMELEGAQQMQSMLDELFNADPAKPESKARRDAIMSQFQAILAAQGKTPQQRQFASQFKLGPQNPDTGEQSAYSYDPNTQQATALNLPGGAQAAPPPEHIQMLQANPDLAAQFEEIYGPGSSAQYRKQ